MSWVRYRFKTKSVDDYRPVVFEPKYPYWCTGENKDSVTGGIILTLKKI